MQEITNKTWGSESEKARSIKDHTLSNKYSSICCWVVTPWYNAMFGCKFTPGVEKCYHSFAKEAILTNI